jgi:serine/threonine protein kinase/tetratricopeptide (TPR) repeat protein
MLGKRLGRYEILAKLGAGGMGEVYRARDQSLGRDVALKLLPETVREDPDRLRRFEQEARAASALNHPNIVTIHDIGQSDGVPYIAMEVIEGQTLRTLMRSKPLFNKRTLGLAAQAAEGLARAHGAGIIHRDLKPDNLMVTHDGLLKILDFGLAKLHEPDALLAGDAPTEPATRPGVLMGTVGYMSPEQAKGCPVDFRSDQFSCGAILYELATGRRAFEKETPIQTLAAVIEEDPTPIHELNPLVPTPFRWIVERCLKKNPDERYASTVDLARELRNVHERLDEVPSGPRALPWSGRSPWSGRGTRFTAASLVALPLAWALFSGHPPKQSAPLEPLKQLVVLPCQAIGATAEDQAYCDGLTQTLAARLAPLAGASTLQITPVGTARARNVDTAQKAVSEFGASLALEGRVQRSGAALLVRYALIDARARTQVDAYATRAGAAESFGIEDRVVEWAARALALEPPPSSQPAAGGRGTRVAAAAELSMQGRGFLLNHQKLENVESAIASFSRALELDPGYAAAHAGLGEAYWRKYRATTDRDWVQRAGEACGQALRRDPNLAAAHICLGTVQSGQGRYEEATASLTRALTLDPANDDAYASLANAQQSLGNVEAAEKTYRHAIALRPRYWMIRLLLATFYRTQNRHAEALEQYRETAALAPESSWAHAALCGAYVYFGSHDEAVGACRRSVELGPSWAGYANWGMAYFRMRRFSEATAMLEQARTLRPDCRTYVNLARAYYWRGERVNAAALYESAVRLCQNELEVNERDLDARFSLIDCYAKLGKKPEALEHLKRVDPGRDAHLLFFSAIAYNQLGDRDTALTRLEQAKAQKLPLRELQDWVELDNLRGEPRFQALLPYGRGTPSTAPGS